MRRHHAREGAATAAATAEAAAAEESPAAAMAVEMASYVMEAGAGEERRWRRRRRSGGGDGGGGAVADQGGGDGGGGDGGEKEPLSTAEPTRWWLAVGGRCTTDVARDRGGSRWWRRWSRTEMAVRGEGGGGSRFDAGWLARRNNTHAPPTLGGEVPATRRSHRSCGRGAVELNGHGPVEVRAQQRRSELSWAIRECVESVVPRGAQRGCAHSCKQRHGKRRRSHTDARGELGRR